MSELKAIVDAAAALRARGESFLIGTVMRVRGSSYRRAGARMLAADGRWVTGSISGGCLEREILAKGAWRTREAEAVLLLHDEALDETSGSGCQGAIEVLLERDAPEGDCDPIAFIAGCLRAEDWGVIVTVFRSERSDLPLGARLCLRAGTVASTIRDPATSEAFSQQAETALRARTPTRVLARDGIEALCELIVPPPHLFVFGAAHDAMPVVAFAKELGWSVSVWDGQPRVSARERLRAADRYLRGSIADAVAQLQHCARPLAVVMGHHYEQDRDVLSALLRTPVRYIGVLGPRRRTERMLVECGAQGAPLDADSLARVHGPVGLALGAETPAEIALSIVAQAQSVLMQARAHSLRSDQATTPGAETRAARVIGLMLAAGRSTRMGHNKLLAALDGMPLITHAVDAALEAGLHAVWVVTGHEAAAVREALAGRAVSFVHNPDFARGLAGSLRAGLLAIGSDVDGILVLLGDMPLVRAADIRCLINAFEHTERKLICVPEHAGRRGNPVLWPAGERAALMSLEGDVGGRELLRAHEDRVLRVPIEHDGVLTDVDTQVALSAVATRDER